MLNFFAHKNQSQTYAFPHAGIRYFDFRYDLYPEIKDSKNKYFPDYLLEHSIDSKKNFNFLKIKKKRIIKTESLRFLDIKKLKIRKNIRKKNILVFLDLFDNKKSDILDIVSQSKLLKQYNEQKETT